MTVVEQVSPDSVSFVLRNPVHDRKEPGDFDARHPAIHDDEIRIGKVGNEGGDDVLE